MSVVPASVRVSLFLSAAFLALDPMTSAVRADNSKDHNNNDRYQQVNLVSDIPGLAMLEDANLVNAWGVSFSPTSPFWISDNGTGKSTVYQVTYDDHDAVNVQVVTLPTPPNDPLVVTIPGEGTPTGQVFANGFAGEAFIFASEDGTISGWHGALGTTAEALVTEPGAVYKGITLWTPAEGSPILLAANFSEGTIDAFDASMNRVQFVDPAAPDGYSPFNIQNFDGKVYVTFALQDPATGDDVAGRGHGFIDVFDPATGTFSRFASGSDAGGNLHEINSPWGLAMAPDTFGKHAGELLVGNFGSGTIMAFDPATGKFRGLLQGSRHGAVVIDGLWALAFGNGGRAGRPSTLYFTAGPEDESHGLFGSLEPVTERDDDSDDDD